MKNTLKVLLVGAFGCMPLLGSKTIEKNKMQLDDLAKDVLVYSKANLDPRNGHYPLMHRLMEWNHKASSMCGQDKQELMPEAEKVVTQIFDVILAHKPTYRQAADAADALADMYCPLVKWDSEECKNMQEKFDKACDKIWQDRKNK